MSLLRAISDAAKSGGLQEAMVSILTGKLKKKTRLPPGRAEMLVAKYLRKHKSRAAAGLVSVREVHRETGASIGTITGTRAWRALQDRLEQVGLSRRPQKGKTIPYTKAMDDVGGDADVRRLIAEQAATDEGSSLDPGRRPKARVRERF
jgi:hypothetical protein